jgi:hypothetical protein
MVLRSLNKTVTTVQFRLLRTWLKLSLASIPMQRSAPYTPYMSVRTKANPVAINNIRGAQEVGLTQGRSRC